MLDKLLSYIHELALLRPGERVGVAVSGGADSVALLRLLLQARQRLGIVLSVVHFNHKIRGADADADETFVRDLARQFHLDSHCDSGDTPAYAREQKLSLEAAGHDLRYQFFWKLVTGSMVNCVATAHTRDDQAETVLMRFLRGSGGRGLAAIYPDLPWRQSHSRQQIESGEVPVGDPPWIIRPLLDFTHAELCVYLNSVHQSWREDATNRDVSFARNRIRHELLPLLRQYNPALDQVLADTAEMARAEEEYWSGRIASELPRILAQSAIDNRQSAINVRVLLAHPLALQRRLVRAAAGQFGLRLDFHHVEQVLELAGASAGKFQKKLELPHGWEAVRSGRELRLAPRCQRTQAEEYDCPLPVPGEVKLAAIKLSLRATPLPAGAAGVKGAAVLDAGFASGLRVRNWRPGDRYWPGYRAAPKKLKELLQARHIPRLFKRLWPVVIRGEEVIWVPGFAVPTAFRPRNPEGPVLLLEQVLLGSEGKKGP